MESDKYNNIWKKMVKIIGQINSVSNPEGHGRDDFTVEILIMADKLIWRISAT